MKLNDRELNEVVDAMKTSGSFDLQPPEGYESDEDSLGEMSTDLSIEIEIEDEYEDDGQPSEYDEWQDFYGGDDNYYDSGVDF
jgi:hypothetical protein